jgi:SAM-dependent methyltransferase
MTQMPDTPALNCVFLRQHRRVLARFGKTLSKDSCILDFGCGEGKLVYEYRDAGFDAYGFDIRPAPLLRTPGDGRYFGFSLTGQPANVPDYRVEGQDYRIPYPDGWFDFIFSTSTLEHVQDHELAFAEIARVLKPGGISLHTFPARFRLIESHIKVPLGGWLQSFPWFLLWSLAGVRNQFQRHLGPVECARNNAYFSGTGLKYPPLRDIMALANRYFDHAGLMPPHHVWDAADNPSANVRRAVLFHPLVSRFICWASSRCWTIVLVLRKNPAPAPREGAGRRGMGGPVAADRGVS